MEVYLPGVLGHFRGGWRADESASFSDRAAELAQSNLSMDPLVAGGADGGPVSKHLIVLLDQVYSHRG